MPDFGEESLGLVVLWVTGEYSPLSLAGSRKGCSWLLTAGVVSLRHARVAEIKMIARMEEPAPGVGCRWLQRCWRQTGFVFAVSTAAEPGKVLVTSDLKWFFLCLFCWKFEIICLAWPKQVCLIENARG